MRCSRIYRSRSRKTRRRWHFREKSSKIHCLSFFFFFFFLLFSFQQGNDFCIPIVIIPEVRKQIFESSNTNLCKQQNNQIEYIRGGNVKLFSKKQNKTKTSQIWRWKTKKSLIHETKNQGNNIIQFPGRFIFPLLLLLLLLFSNEEGGV
jgi:hypothetical protein